MTSAADQLLLALGLEHLADLRTWQVVPDLYLLRGLDAAQTLLDEGGDLDDVEGLTAAYLEHGGDALAPLHVGKADHGAVLDRGVGHVVGQASAHRDGDQAEVDAVDAYPLAELARFHRRHLGQPVDRRLVAE